MQGFRRIPILSLIFFVTVSWSRKLCRNYVQPGAKWPKRLGLIQRPKIGALEASLSQDLPDKKHWNLIGRCLLTWTTWPPKHFWTFYNLVKLFTVQNRLEWDPQLPCRFLFWIKSNLSCRADQFVSIASCTLSLTNKKCVFLPLFAASPQIVTPIASPVVVELRPPPNTEYIRHLSRPD